MRCCRSNLDKPWPDGPQHSGDERCAGRFDLPLRDPPHQALQVRNLDR